jgi:hypothetical protein
VAVRAIHSISGNTVNRRPIQLEAPRLTAQLVVSDTEAYLAYSWTRDPLGPNGEQFIASILHTRDGGSTWIELPWLRSWWSRVRHKSLTAWPPEAVIMIDTTKNGVGIGHRDEWVPFEQGEESLWRSVFSRGQWHTSRVRRMDYEGSDSTARVPEITAQLPPAMRLPSLPHETAERIWGSHSNPP